jgi:arginine-tRNA-protein transferase
MNAPVEFRILALANYEHPCSYLPGRTACMEFGMPWRLSPAKYETLLERGFRRSGSMVYRPVCRSCRECQALRVLTAEFRPDRSMRRCWKTNQDLEVRIGKPEYTPQKGQLYRRYLEMRHEREAPEGPQEFLYDSPVSSSEICFYRRNQLISVAIVDQVPSGLSAVYTYFDPDHSARGLGTFAVLWELDYCRRQALPHLYLGYYVRDCRKMNYKNRFQPFEILSPTGAWCRGE